MTLASSMPASTRQAESWIAVIGNPNTGKTTLFNALTGGRARTGNYPGVTVDKRFGLLRGVENERIQLLDLPGTYSLAARTADELVAVEALLGHADGVPKVDAVLLVVDATNLERNLYLLTQVLEAGLPTLVALNMVDGARSRGITVDVPALERALGLRVVPTVASRGEGVAELRAALEEVLDAAPPPRPWTWPPFVLEGEEMLRTALTDAGLDDVAPIEVRRALFDVGGEMERRFVGRGGAGVEEAITEARRRVREEGVRLASVEASVRYGFIGEVARQSVTRPDESVVTISDRIDTVLTHRIFGTILFVAIMTLVFVSIFTWAAPLMDFIDGTVFGGLKDAAEGWTFLGDGALRSLVIDGVIAGVGGVLVFLPQILILFGFLAILEGCGYMARAALLTDRLMRGVGLSGRSFIPLLSSFACAVPGVMAARTIENRRDRIATMLVAPLMSCGARIPIYVILIATFVPATMFFGFLNLQGLVFAGMYVLGIVVAVLVALVLKRTLLRGPSQAFMVELPPYRIPRPSVVLHRMWEQGSAFVLRAGTVIFAASILVWALSYFPRMEADGPEGAQTQAVSENTAAGEALAHSYLGRIGRTLEPLFAPMGWDWKVSAAVVASFPAREVVVSTLGVIYNLGPEEDEQSAGLRQQLAAATWDHGPKKGTPVFDLAGALSLMVFFALCAQCMSTLATIAKEAHSWRWAAFSFAYMTTIAYVAAVLTAWIVRGLS